LALARNSFDLEVLNGLFASNEKEIGKLRDSLAELRQLSLVFEEGKRYTLNPELRSLVLLEAQQSPGKMQHFYKRSVKTYIALCKKYGGTDWGNWSTRYDFIEAEWENIQVALQWCLAKDNYAHLRELWMSINHFTDLYGHWNDRLAWLNVLRHLSQQHEDDETYVWTLAREAWTLIMIDKPESLEKAERLIQQAWSVECVSDPETQSILAHHHVRLYIRTKEYRKAKEALKKQRTMLTKIQDSTLERRIIDRHRVNFLINQARLDLAEHHFDRAKTRFKSALKQAKGIDWLRGYCYILNKLGDIALEQNNLEEAEEYLLTGWSIAKQNRNKRRMAGYLSSLAHLARLRGNNSQAQDLARSASQTFEHVGMDNKKQEVLTNFGLKTPD
jgi:tetratricopeptide (TPR) repeat protein